MRRLRKTFLVVLTGIFLAGSLVTATTIITGNHPDGYELEPELLPSENINATNATLRANLEEMDEVYDAALVYWNLTDTTTGETIRGPAAIGFEKGETVEADYVGLEPDAEYTLQAYTEPVVWDDDTLFDNFVENVKDFSPEVSDSVADDADAMEAVADSSVAMSVVLRSNYVEDVFWQSPYSENFFWEENIVSGHPFPEVSTYSNGFYFANAGTGTRDDYEVWEFHLDLTDVSTLQFDYSGEDSDAYNSLRVKIGEDQVLTAPSSGSSPTIQVDDKSGVHEITFLIRDYNGREYEVTNLRAD